MNGKEKRAAAKWKRGNGPGQRAFEKWERTAPKLNAAPPMTKKANG